ncbi:MAG TPA: ribosome maturation factor RimM, partial [Mycobacteriales bacterium]
MPAAGRPAPHGRDDVLVGRVGRAHGLRGDVAVEVRTDAPELRFAEGAVLRTDLGPVTVQHAVWHSGRLLLRFVGVEDRTAAEDLRGLELRIGAEQRGDPGDDAWWDEDLIGLAAVTPAGDPLGTVTDVVHAAQVLVAVTDAGGREVLVPFVRALVPTVDVAGG